MSIPLPLKPEVVFEEGNRAQFEIAGLYPGYGQTIGNSLRRVLLSSLEGAAITSVKIEGVGHEFTTIEGVMEDIVELILNLKQLRFRLHEKGPFSITLSAKDETKVTGGDFSTPSQVEVMNKEIHIATLTSKKSVLALEAVVESGLGYVSAEARSKEKVAVGVIALDASFSPVRNVHYEVENMRLGDRTDYNRVRFSIETDGSLSPREALTRSAAILVEQFQTLTHGFTEIESVLSVAEEKISESDIEKSTAEEEVLKTKLDELKFSARTLNVLREAGIKTVGGLSRKKESTVREIEGLGEKGMQEIKKVLGNLGIILKQ